jgi:glucose/arabinose dehydrogenase
MARHGSLAAPIVVVAALLLSACAATPAPVVSSTPTTNSPSPTPSATAVRGPVQPAGDPVAIASGLTSPWSILRLDDGTVLISERDTGVIQRVGDDGSLSAIGTVPDVVHSGEGGLLGIATLSWAGRRWLYAYETTASDNRIVRMLLDSDLALGAPQVVLAGLAKAGNHNGGRIAFGPDGMLYATVGDAAVPARAQDPGSLNGKILRMTPAGGVPDDNPFPGSLVYSLGHRNPQGIAWDADGQLWAAEFGQNTWDEFNRIEAGANYGWPVVEGVSGQSGFVDPVLQWPTDQASPSGLSYVDGTFFLAALRGTRVWAIYPESNGGPDAVAWFEGQFGRIRDVAPGPDGTLWFISNNTDGRGKPGAGDDHLYQVRLVPLEEG